MLHFKTKFNDRIALWIRTQIIIILNKLKDVCFVSFSVSLSEKMTEYREINLGTLNFFK